jgi:hypothetical protein
VVVAPARLACHRRCHHRLALALALALAPLALRVPA